MKCMKLASGRNPPSIVACHVSVAVNLLRGASLPVEEVASVFPSGENAANDSRIVASAGRAFFRCEEGIARLTNVYRDSATNVPQRVFCKVIAARV